MATYLRSIAILLACTLVLAACGGGTTTEADKPAPIVSSVEPASGGVGGGTALKILGRNFTNRSLGITEVRIGGLPATKVVVRSDTEITCATPAGIEGMAEVAVTKNHGTGMMADAFHYFPPPDIIALNETEGSRDGGKPVIVKGMYFQDTEPGETRVLFGGIPGTGLMIVDDETIEVMTPKVPFEKTVDVLVENFNGSDVLPLSFRFRGPRPVVFGIDPETGSTEGGTMVTITGEAFSAASIPYTVMFDETPAYNVKLVSETEITCSAPVFKAIGPVEVRVGNSNGMSDDFGTFTYYAPPSTLRSIEPEVGYAEETTPVTITGSGFVNFEAGEPTVLFGDEEALNVTVVSDVMITCDAPALPSGFVDVTVSNNRGSSTMPSAFEYRWVPVWESTFGDQLTLVDQKGGYTDDDEGYATVDIEFGDDGEGGFEFYGEEYDECYAAANGYVNFAGKTYFTFSGNFGSYPQINVAGGDMWAMSSSIKGSGVFARTTSELVIITFYGISWYYDDGYVTGQLQLHESGAFAIMIDEIKLGSGASWNPMTLGCCPASGYTQKSVDWTDTPSFTVDDAPVESWSSSFDLTGKALAFYPDGEGGYVTRLYDLD